MMVRFKLIHFIFIVLIFFALIIQFMPAKKSNVGDTQVSSYNGRGIRDHSYVKITNKSAVNESVPEGSRRHVVSSRDVLPVLVGDSNEKTALAGANIDSTKVRKYEISEESCATLESVESLDCYTQLAVKVENLSYCDFLKNQVDRDACIRHFSVNYTTGCLRYGNDTVKKFACFWEAANVLDNITHCESIYEGPPYYAESVCKNNFLLLKRGRLTASEMDELGNLIKHSEIRDYTLALLFSDLSYCDSLKTDSIVDGMRSKCMKCTKKMSVDDCRLFIDPQEGKVAFSN
ncbi:MAG: hypothetical protein KKD39_05360 [Candidatus Altiarchaeota archaeon]|nr:hypothetical protein [Candidatus Altiarchaeota archaeon]